jgi:hypothetical protein
VSERVWALAELIIGFALLLSLIRLAIPVDTAQRILRFIKRFLFGDKI